MNIEGEIEVNGEKLERRDAIGIWETTDIEIKAKLPEVDEDLQKKMIIYKKMICFPFNL